MTRQFLWLDFDSTRPSHESTRKNFRWLWLDKNDSGTSLVFLQQNRSLFAPCWRKIEKGGINECSCRILLFFTYQNTWFSLEYNDSTYLLRTQSSIPEFSDFTYLLSKAVENWKTFSYTKPLPNFKSFLPGCILTERCKRWTRADPASTAGGGAISVIFGSQASLLIHYCWWDEVYFTTLLSQNNGRQNGLISRMLLSELYTLFSGIKRNFWLAKFLTSNGQSKIIHIKYPEKTDD